MSLSTLNLLIGLAVVYLLLSLVLAAFREAIEARLKSRARHLALGIMQLLNSREDAKRLYNGPLIAALYRPDDSTIVNRGMATETYASPDDDVPLPPADFKGFSGIGAPFMLIRAMVNRPIEAELPSYIPATTFVHGLIALALEKAAEAQPASGEHAAIEQPKVTLQAFSNALDHLAAHGSYWARSLRILIASAGDDFDKAVKNIEDWYDGSMDRVSGWYRRESHFIAFWMGLVLAIALNVDSIFLAKHLATNEQARNHLVKIAAEQSERIQQSVADLKQSRKPAASPGSAVAGSSVHPAVSQDQIAQQRRVADDRVTASIKDFNELGLPIGWSLAKFRAMNDPIDGSGMWNWIQAIIGWIITALALCLGAPFWFDVLNKVMVIRSTVKPKEKSREEASEDRQI
jgi:hypothetical protein